MPVQLIMLFLVSLGIIIYGYRIWVIAAFYMENGRFPTGRHSTSNLVFGFLAFGMIVYLWNELNWPGYILLLFGLAMLLKLSTDYYYTNAQLFRLNRHSEPLS